MLIALGLFLTSGGAMVPLIMPGHDDAGISPADESAPADETSAGSAATPLPAMRAAAGAGARLVVLTDRQIGHVGEPLLLPVGVLVEDAEGRAVEGASVALAVTGGGGRVASDVAVSDARGLVTSRWTLGDTPGLNELTARIQGTEIVAVLRATSVAAIPARLLAANGDDQTAVRGSVLPEAVVVRVEDVRGNGVAGARVDFSVTGGGGSVQPVFAHTDSTGSARAFFTIGTGQEANTLRASLEQSELHVEFIARGQYRLDPQPRLVAGGTHTCLLGAALDVSCWGASGNSRIVSSGGDRAAGDSPVRAAPPFARLAAGVSQTCALDRHGRAHCWGVNDDGQLGVGDRNDRATPAPVHTGESFVAITAGLTHTCALTGEGRAFCWGDDSTGQSGDGSAGGVTLPVRVGGGQVFTSISAGWRHTCGLTSQGDTWCWGSNSDGQLGDGTLTSRASPARVAGGHRFIAITTGAAHSCGVTAGGEAYCWGQNGSGQLGAGSRTDSSNPMRVLSAARFSDIVAGAVHSCALTRAGDAFCWGRNNFGQLGNESTTDAPSPSAVTGGIRFTYLTASGSHTCGRADAGEFYCWGYNVEGQLGDGTRANRSRPVPVRVAAR
jgi:alpha-tubulin suppressor-like RCC1 family protein